MFPTFPHKKNVQTQRNMCFVQCWILILPIDTVDWDKRNYISWQYWNMCWSTYGNCVKHFRTLSSKEDALNVYIDRSTSCRYRFEGIILTARCLYASGSYDWGNLLTWGSKQKFCELLWLPRSCAFVNAFHDGVCKTRAHLGHSTQPTPGDNRWSPVPVRLRR